ncbi:MAG: response regulator transcription factor [Alistipes sp.]|nr:response regulator transcription factor [Alistipes sp.]
MRLIIFSADRAAAHFVEALARHSQSRVWWCVSWHHLIEQCNTVMPDLVIILSLSPFIEGLPFVEELRRHTLGRVPIYVIGWQQSERAVLSLLESGVDQYMTFPISLHRLYGKIRQRAESLGVNV